jgi:hypothetical membrane protein
VAGSLLFLLAAQFMTVIMLAASIVSDYNYKGSAISDFGIAPDTAMIFNLSLIVVGSLNILGGMVLSGAHRRRGLLVIYLVAGLGAIGAGLFPLNTGAPHSLSALVAFIFFNVQAISTGFVAKGPMRWISFAAGLVGLLFVGIMVIGDGGDPSVFGSIGHGGIERMIVYPPMVWLIAFGGYLMGRREEVWNGRTMPVTSS